VLNEWISAAEVMEILGCSEAEVSRKGTSGELERRPTDGGLQRWEYSRASVLEYFKERQNVQ